MVDDEDVPVPNACIPHALAVYAEHIHFFRLLAAHEYVRQGECIFNILCRKHRNAGCDTANERHGKRFFLRAIRQVFGVDKHGALLGRIARDQSLFLQIPQVGVYRSRGF
ncbi:hypothetical protein SDC9_153045 [bioreactor metagenome]|uniref:Uncharacterized protein n=1 Tax=bioreactor metagenome TaxID=1076179 RepID=A0A645EX30_9ZZZZ